MRRWLEKLFNRIWYRQHWISHLFKPIGLLYGFITRIRRQRYLDGRYSVSRHPVPVIVVGNLTVGGSGKTPLVIWLVDFLRKTGYKPAIVSRGYGGRARSWPQQARVDSDPLTVGDEAVLLATRCRCPVAVGPDRNACVDAILRHTDANLVIADDGLQHYALGRDIEIVVVDGHRRFGNGELLPAGPLREPVSRLKEVDMVVANGPARRGEFSMQLHAHRICRLRGEECVDSSKFVGSMVHAVAGIGHPERFFTDLRNQGLSIEEHIFPDHYTYRASDIDYGDDIPVLMTEKDAVKCRRFTGQQYWYVPVEAELDKHFGPRLLALLDKVAKRRH